MIKNGAFTNANVRVHDLNGKLVYNDILNSSRQNIKLRETSSGLYVVTLLSSSDTYSKKLIFK